MPSNGRGPPQQRWYGPGVQPLTAGRDAAVMPAEPADNTVLTNVDLDTLLEAIADSADVK